MTFKEVMALDEASIMKLSDEELDKALKVAVSAANKRLKRQREQGIYSPAAAQVDRSGGKFTSKFDARNQEALRMRRIHELLRIRNFISSQTGSMKGAKEWRGHIEEIWGSTPEDQEEWHEFHDFERIVSDIFDQVVNELGGWDSLQGKFTSEEIKEQIRMLMQEHEVDGEYDEVAIRNDLIDWLQKEIQERPVGRGWRRD